MASPTTTGYERPTGPGEIPASEAVDADLLKEEAYLKSLDGKPLPARLVGYLKLSGPGWLQSALTLGGGSLANSLYLGVLAGFGFLWLQPLAMILGIIMLSAIGYVTLSTGKRPFRAINQDLNPVLGWSWLIASMMANMIWALPQYSLAVGVVQQNLMPGIFGPEGSFGDVGSRVVLVSIIFVICTVITWSYGSGHWGVRLYERMLKVLVAAVVACFVGVLAKLAFSEGLPWGAFWSGFVPDFSALFRPSDSYQPLLAEIAKADPAAAEYWSRTIVATQRDSLMGAFATAVGINMTFLLPYSMLGRGWGRAHRGLSIFDLSTGMFIPFVLATTCVVASAATQFHAVPQPGLLEGTGATAKQINGFNDSLAARISSTGGTLTPEQLPVAEKQLAAMLVDRDAQALSQALAPLLGDEVANIVFGLGVLGMALSTITLLMLVAGMVTCEVLDVPPSGWPLRWGSLFAATGVLGPFIFSGRAAFWLAVPTSVIALVLLPIAYLTFFLMMNSRRMLGDQLPRGGKRVLVNLLLGVSTGVAFFASGWVLISKVGLTWAIVIGLAFLGLIALGSLFKRKPSEAV